MDRRLGMWPRSLYRRDVRMGSPAAATAAISRTGRGQSSSARTRSRHPRRFGPRRGRPTCANRTSILNEDTGMNRRCAGLPDSWEGPRSANSVSDAPRHANEKRLTADRPSRRPRQACHGAMRLALRSPLLPARAGCRPLVRLSADAISSEQVGSRGVRLACRSIRWTAAEGSGDVDPLIPSGGRALGRIDLKQAAG